VNDHRPVALVTGAGERVGRAIAVHLAGEGYDVAVHYYSSESGARETSARCRARYARAPWFNADLSDPSAAQMLVERVMGSLGRLDAVVNSAAIMLRTPLESLTPAQWDQIFAVNLRAPFFLSLAASHVLPDGGAIVNIGDHLADEEWAHLVPHAISKAGVATLTRQLARQFAPRIRVNAVTPGAVLPPADWAADAQAEFAAATPLGRIGTPEDVASAVAYLLRAPYVTGHNLVVDGGRHLR
jgi:pteridine reductase